MSAGDNITSVDDEIIKAVGETGMEISEDGVDVMITDSMKESSDSTSTSTISSGNDSDSLYMTIWDSPYIEKSGRKGDDTEVWKCNHCNVEFRKYNATKALLHVMRKIGHHIQPCNGRIVPSVAAKYEELWRRHISNSEHKKRKAETLDQSIEERNQKSASTISEFCKRHSAIFKSSKRQNFTASPINEGTSIQTQLPFSSRTDSKEKCSSITTQESLLSMTIADFIHANGLPFRVVEDPRLRKIIELSKHVPKTYRPPNRELVQTELLHANFEQYQEKSVQNSEAGC